MRPHLATLQAGLPTVHRHAFGAARSFAMLGLKEAPNEQTVLM